MSDQRLLEETIGLLEDYLRRRLCKETRPQQTPVAETLWRVSEELLNVNRAFYSESCEKVPGECDPRVILQRVAAHMSEEGGLNWGRVVVLIVFAGTLLQRRGDHKAGTPRELAAVLSQFLLGDHRDWFQENGGWDGFHKFCNKNRNGRVQENGTFSNALIAAAGFGIAGLVFLLAVR
ncbi:bcl-2-like protein 10 [Pseudophryne corroboree]|uniref:bcl-2-like protein 10 n=1 Tax=Pseudophryne corroboree TaxID=495146 RepID=UPI003081C0B4